MITIIQTGIFIDWLKSLKDVTAKTAILKRLKRAEKGNFGDTESVGEGVSEMKIDVGAGYRAYYKRSGSVAYLMLCGGNKKTQPADIRRAKKIARDLGL